MRRALRRRVGSHRERLQWLRGRAALVSPAARLADQALQVENLGQRILRALRHTLGARRTRFTALERRLWQASPRARVRGAAVDHAALLARLRGAGLESVRRGRERLQLLEQPCFRSAPLRTSRAAARSSITSAARYCATRRTPARARSSRHGSPRAGFAPRCRDQSERRELRVEACVACGARSHSHRIARRVRNRAAAGELGTRAASAHPPGLGRRRSALRRRRRTPRAGRTGRTHLGRGDRDPTRCSTRAAARDGARCRRHARYRIHRGREALREPVAESRAPPSRSIACRFEALAAQA